MSTITRWVIGNWKMNGSINTNANYFQQLSSLVESNRIDCHLGLAVPAPYFHQAQTALEQSTIAWGSQDISSLDKGARTSEVSAAMLNEFNCKFSLIGHSERRLYWSETDDIVAVKVKQALANNITPVICVGESERQRIDQQTQQVIEQQISVAIADLNHEQISHCIFAYEPVWAIGTGKSASPDMAQTVHQLIRQLLPEQAPCPILYGGSVTADNAAELFTQPDIDGALVGGASLNAQSLYEIATS